MKLSTFLICLLSSLLAIPLFAQTASRAVQNPVGQFAFYHNTDQGLTHLNFFEKMGAQMQISTTEMVLEAQNTDEQGFTHYKYQQYHQGLPIFGCHYFLHEKDGFVRSANGQFQTNANVSTQATLSAAGAEGFALQAMHSQKYDRKKTRTSLCFINASSAQSRQNLRLAYKIDFHSIKPYNKRCYFVDANTGKILKEFPILLAEGVPGKAKTNYYGVQDIISDSLGPQNFVLRDLTRGEGIFVYNSTTNDFFTNNSSFWDLGAGPYEEVGLDAHYCTEKYYDMMLNDYHWEGVDGEGGALIAKVHDGAYVNAFWDGESTIYGDGDCDYGPLTTLEVVGHEFAHGMVDHSSDLIYGSESGAMNESLADIFGKLLERKTDPANFSWVVAHSFILDPGSSPFRVMNNPKSMGMPAYYKGEYWDDYSDVHVNSSIGNLWFSLIVDGKQGTNEVGYHFNVSALGPDKAGQIVFNTNKNYLSENSTYNDFCNYSIEVAGNLYGQGSPEQLAVTEAWKTVGLPHIVVPTETYDLSLSSGNANFLVNICGLGQYIPVPIVVINTGTIPYTAANPAKVTLSNSSLPDYIITLNDPIAPGDSAFFVVDHWFKSIDYGYQSVLASLNPQDDDPNNDVIYESYTVLQYEHDDLYFSGYIAQPDCFDQTEVGYFSVLNNSCASIPVGTKLTFIGKNELGNTVWTSPEETITTELMGGYSTSYSYDLPVLNETIIYDLIYSPDPDLDNNRYYANPYSGVLPITGNYLNDFETNHGDDGYLYLDLSNSNPILQYANSTFFASTGYFPDPIYFEHCTDPLLVFNNPYTSGLNASIKACVDLSSAPEPTLEFDAALFLNSFSKADNYVYSSMLQAKWIGAQSGNKIIYNQFDGAVKHTKIDLPPHFKGELYFYLYTELGHWEPSTDYLNEDDFVLLDNIKLSGATSATHEAPEKNSLMIAPNPAQETVRIQSEIPMTSIRIFNAAGQSMKTLSSEGLRQDINLKSLPDGLYWINVRLSDGSESAHKLFKIN